GGERRDLSGDYRAISRCGYLDSVPAAGNPFPQRQRPARTAPKANSLSHFLRLAQALVAPAWRLVHVQPLKNHEDAAKILRVDADAVVLHREHPIQVPGLDADVNTWRLGSAELDR